MNFLPENKNRITKMTEIMIGKTEILIEMLNGMTERPRQWWQIRKWIMYTIKINIITFPN